MENILGLDNNLQNTEPSIADTPDLNIAQTETTAPLITDYASTPQVPVRSHAPNPDPFLSAVADADRSANYRESQDKYRTSSYYNPDTKERYSQFSTFYNENFNPEVDNERLALENWDTWDALSAGFSGFKDTFSSSFGEYFRYDRIAKALFNLDVDYLKPDETDLDRMAYDQHQNELKNPIFYAPGTENDFLTKGFLAETISNLGFTFGTISGVFAEQAAFKAVEGGLALLSPETGGASLVAAGELEVIGDARAATGLGRVWKSLVTSFTGKALNSAELLAQEGKLTSNIMREGKQLSSVDDAARTVAQQANTISNGVKYGTGFWDNALKMASKIPFGGEIADAARMYRAGKGILTSKELFQIGIGGFRRSLGEWQLAASEAAIEAGGNYKDTLDQLVDEYKSANGGTAPIGEDYYNLRNIAMRSSTVDFGTNVAILGVMNKIMWGGLFGKFAAESAAISKLRLELGKKAAELGITVVEGVGKKTGKALTQGYQKGFLGTFGLLPKIAEDFSKKEAAWQLGKSSLKGLTRIQLTEGIQENLQEITTGATKDYYVSMYKKDARTWGQSFDEALGEQFTKRGAKTFLSGALTGLFIGPAMHTIQSTMSAFDKNAKAHKQAIKESVDYLNKFYSENHEKVLDESVKQIKLQTDFNNNKLEAISAKDKYQWHNNQDSALIQTIMHAKRTGTLGNLSAFIKGYGETFDNEQFKSAFGFSPEELGASSSGEIMTGLANSVKAYGDIYDGYMTKFGLFLSMDDYLKDPLSKQKFSVRKAAFLDAISNVAFMEAKAQSSINRQAGIRQNITKYKSIGNSLASAFDTLVNPEKIGDSIFIMESEIANLKDSLKVEGLNQKEKDRTLTLIESKEKEKALLSSVYAIMFELKTIPDPNDPTKTASFYDTRNFIKESNVLRKMMVQQITDYLQLKNDQTGINNKVNSEEIDNALNDIFDYMSLGKDHQEYVESVNLLNDPENFGRYHERLMDARVSAHARLLYDDFQDLASISEVGKKFVDDNKELLDRLLSFSKNGAGTFENMRELQLIRDQITAKNQEFTQEAAVQNQKAREESQKKQEEQTQKLNTSRQSKKTKPLISMLIESMSSGDEQLKQEIDTYMAMRFALDELENFPFGETDPEKRVVNRYYIDENGNKILFGDDEFGRIKIPVMSQGENPEPINDLSSLYEYLYNVEEYLYDQTQRETTATPEQSNTVTEKVDAEKSRLANFVGQPVMLNGEKGILEAVNWKIGDKRKSYVVTLENGDVIKLTEINDEDNHSFDDFAELSIAVESLEPETKSEITSSPNPIVDTNAQGTVTIIVNEDFTTATINGVEWEIEKDDNGMVKAFLRLENRKGKKRRRNKTVLLRLSTNTAKGADYAARINGMMTLTAPLPETAEELSSELEVMDSAILEAQKGIFDEKVSRDHSDERLALNQLTRIKDEQIPDDILEIKTKFDNNKTRRELSDDELLKLFMWADDLEKRIRNEFKTRLDTPVVSNALSELNKDYINPINNIINGRGRKNSKGSKKVTNRTPTQEKSIERVVKELESKQAEPTAPEAEPKTPKGERGNLKAAVQSVQLEMDFSGTVDMGEKQSEDTIHELPVDIGSKRIKSITPDAYSKITAAISSTEVDKVPDVPESTSPFAELVNKVSCEIK
jgi:hypothetical protein